MTDFKVKVGNKVRGPVQIEATIQSVVFESDLVGRVTLETANGQRLTVYLSEMSGLELIPEPIELPTGHLALIQGTSGKRMDVFEYDARRLLGDRWWAVNGFRWYSDDEMREWCANNPHRIIPAPSQSEVA